MAPLHVGLRMDRMRSRDKRCRTRSVPHVDVDGWHWADNPKVNLSARL